MKLHRLTFATVALAGAAGVASAQSPGVLYSWDFGVGATAGPSTETWSGGGTNVPVLSNATDGVLTVVESAAGGDWQISEGFNSAKESAADDAQTSSFDFGGVDLLGLDTIEFDVSHNGSGDINGQVFLQPDNGGGCCGFFTQQFTASPGANTVSVDLNALGMTEADFKFVRALGFQVFGHGEAAPLTWQFSEVRTGGAPLTQRVIADYTTSPADLANAVVKFDEAAISGATAGVTDNQDGLSLSGGALRWVDAGGDGTAGDPSGGAVAWGNGNALAVDFLSRPLDVSNYDFAEVTMRATPGAGADDTLGVQFFAQHADRDANNAFAFAGVSRVLPVDGTNYTLVFPLADLGADGDLDLTQWLGLNLDPHAGAMQIQVESVVLTTIPEPTAVALVGLIGLAAAGTRRRSA